MRELARVGGDIRYTGWRREGGRRSGRGRDREGEIEGEEGKGRGRWREGEVDCGRERDGKIE